MKRYLNKYRSTKTKKIIGLALGLIGFIFMISVMPLQILLFTIGLVLVIMGAILIIK